MRDEILGSHEHEAQDGTHDGDRRRYERDLIEAVEERVAAGIDRVRPGRVGPDVGELREPAREGEQRQAAGEDALAPDQNSATLTMVTSNSSMSVPRHTATNVHHLLTPATLPLTDSAHLRPLELADAGSLTALIEANLDHLRPWMPWAAAHEPLATLAFVQSARRQAEEEQGAQFAIVREDRLAGTIGFHGINWANRSTSVGYWLAADAQGHGIVTAAVHALCDLAFRGWGLHRVELRAHPDNARSQAVAERCGFVREGVARQAERVGDEYRDLVVYSLLAP